MWLRREFFIVNNLKKGNYIKYLKNLEEQNKKA